MPTITLRLDDWTRDEVDRLAQATGVTISDLLRAKIDELVGKDVELPREDAPRSLSLIHRRILTLQHKILAQLADDEYDEGYHRRRMEVLEEGFTAEYGDEFAAIRPELAAADCSLVWDILDMFTVLEASLRKLTPSDIASLGEFAESRLSFRGFDGNDNRESRLLDYMIYLIGIDKWKTLAYHVADERDNGNSHMPMLTTYQRMLRVYQPIVKSKVSRGGGRDSYLFTAAELGEALKA